MELSEAETRYLIDGKGKRNFICTPLADDILLVFSLNSLSIFLALIVDCRGNVNCGFLCFHNAYELQSK